MSSTFPRDIVRKAVARAGGTIIDTHRVAAWGPGFAVTVYSEAEAAIFLTALGVSTENSSLVVDHAYRLAADAKIRKHNGNLVVYFPGWELKD